MQAGDYAERLTKPAEQGSSVEGGAGDNALPSAEAMRERVAGFEAFPADQLTSLLGGLGASG